MKYSRTNRILHLLMVITVSMQLLSQFWMFVPSPDKLPDTQIAPWLFVIHLCIGVMGFCFVAVRLLSVMDDENDSKRLYPFAEKESAMVLWSEFATIPSWLKKGPPSPGEDSSVASAIHGLGLLLVLGLGTTGILFYIGLAPDGAMDMMTALFRSTHEFLAIFLWIYLAGHIGMYILHKIRGHHEIQDIFSFDKDK